MYLQDLVVVVDSSNRTFSMRIDNYNSNIPFNGTTQVYAISDSHQETRKTSAFLSKILDEAKEKDNVLLLNCGDIFKGIYPRELEKDCYIKMKEAKPDIEMVMTLGNNDFGFNKESLDFLINTVKTFTTKGIQTVCANIFDDSGKRPNWLKPYTIVKRDGDKNFITGFCIDNINTKKFGIIPKKQDEVVEEIINAIKTEQPDNVIILNHDYMPSSQKIVKTCKENGINVDLVIGGHDHDYVSPDTKLNIYYPQSFSDSMYKMDIINENSVNKISNVETSENDGLGVSPIFEKDLIEYETETGLLDKIVPYTLNLTKQYSKPCPLGSFLADKMRDTANTDIAFFSTGFLMKPLEYKPNTFITNYLFKKTMIADTPIKTVELTSDELKTVFAHSLKSHGYGNSNPKFLQCSNNIKIIGHDNPEKQQFELEQIYIDNNPLFDSKGNALDRNKKYTCAIDSYIADGGQGFETLKQAIKDDVIANNEPIKINEVLMNGLKEAYKDFEPGSQYPSFELIDK